MNSRLFKRRTETLHNMGLNAQILASHSKDAKAVLSVLVREISALTSNTSKVLEEIGKGCEDLGKSSIMTIRTAHLLQIYQSAWEAGLETKSCRLLLSAFNNENKKMLQGLSDVKLELYKHQEKLKRLQSSTLFIPALISLININVAKFREFSDQFSDITKELEDFKTVILHSSESMIQGIADSIQTIETAESPNATNENLLETSHA